MEILIITLFFASPILITLVYNFIQEVIRLKKLEKEHFKTLCEISEYKRSILKTNNAIKNDFNKIKNEHPDVMDYISSLMADYYTYDIHLNEKYLLEHMKSKKELKNALEIRALNVNIQEEIKRVRKSLYKIPEQIDVLHQRFLDSTGSNLTAIPYMAAIIADYETYGIEILAKQLNWGKSIERAKKVASIREIRKATQQMIERNMEAKYQLEYLLSMFPNLQDIIETDYNELPVVKIEELSDYDRSRDWLSKEEYQKLNSVERNQLALDRYKDSHNKTKWQIGRDYELYVGYKYGQKGYTVDYFGSYMGLEDLGRDLIAKKDDKILIIQCKYWSKDKQIHEKHITQLYGTVASYCIEKNLPKDAVKGLLITNISLSDMAKKMATYLNVDFVENYPIDDYPCIKCNIGHGENGPTKIYHLPFDQQYDITKIDAPGEFFAMTVKEAEKAGFRRAFKWFGNN